MTSKGQLPSHIDAENARVEESWKTNKQEGEALIRAHKMLYSSGRASGSIIQEALPSSLHVEIYGTPEEQAS